MTCREFADFMMDYPSGELVKSVPKGWTRPEPAAQHEME